MVGLTSFLPVVAALLVGEAFAAPPSQLLKRDALESGKTDYTVEEIQNTFMKNTDKITDNCVFYVNSFVDDAKKYQAAVSGRQSLYSKYIEDSTSDRFPFNENKDPMKSYDDARPSKRRDWFSITSRAYADLCHGTVYFVWDGKKAFSDGIHQSIWLSDELPQMRSKGQITAVKIVVPDSNTNPTNWKEEAYPDWQDKNNDDPSPSKFPSGRDTPNKRNILSYTGRRALNLVRRASGSQPTKPKPETDPNVSGTTFARADDGWVLGNCTVYLNQLLKEDDEGVYNLDVSLYDGGGFERVNDMQWEAHANKPINQSSTLPYNLTISVGAGKSDPIHFTYGAKGEQKFTNDNSSSCETGPYDGAGRNISCPFDC